MEKAEAVIFDMDGTLYQFTDGRTFGESLFGRTIQKNIRTFIQNEFSLSEVDATKEYNKIKNEYGGEFSLGFEKEYNIERRRFFDNTWDLDPRKFINTQIGLRDALARVEPSRILLTAAPRIWTDRVLGYLGISDLFEDRIYTGEPDIRKPNPEAFRQIVTQYDLVASRVVSIGDQEFSDILPAQEIGMQTVLIGSAETVADLSAGNVVDAINKLINRGIV